MSEWAEKCISMETEYTPDYVKSLATSTSNEKNMASSVSSGTNRVDGMIIAPCSMKTLSAIANGYDETLIARAAGVTIKGIPKTNFNGKRNSTLCNSFRKHVKAYLAWVVVILPPVTEFYTKPKSIDDIVNHGVGKCLDQFNIEHDLYPQMGYSLNYLWQSSL